MRPRIAVIGRFEVDFELHFPALPAASHLARGRDISRLPGGSGLLASVALRRLGAEASPAGRVGKDGAGRRILAFLEEEGLETHYIVDDPILPTATFVRLIEESGATVCRDILFEGAAARYSADDAAFAFQPLGYRPESAGVLVCGDLPDDAVTTALSLAAKQYLPVLLDATPPRAANLPIGDLCAVDIFLIDAEGARNLTGMDPSGMEKCLKCCIALASLVRAKYYLIKMREGSIFLYDGTYHRFLPGYESAHPGSAVSHGCFVAALIAKYIASGNILRAGELAVAAEALAREHATGAATLPTSAMVKKFLARAGGEGEGEE